MAEKRDKIAEFIKLQSPETKMDILCRAALRCYEGGETVAVHVAAEDEARVLDERMWTFNDQSFMPHALAAEATEPVIEPVLIYWGEQEVGEADALIEAAGGEPAQTALRYDHIVDFAEVYDHTLREVSRKRYTALREAGYRMRFIE